MTNHRTLHEANQTTETSIKRFGSGGIRTHASEETGALNQRLRPLGHATFLTTCEGKNLEIQLPRCDKNCPSPRGMHRVSVAQSVSAFGC